MTLRAENGRYILTARKGKVVTNGEIYGKQIILAIGLASGDYYEIDESEVENGAFE